jgi:hypothetical protein
MMADSLNMNGAHLSPFALDMAISIFKDHGSVMITGVPGAPERTFTELHDLEILKQNSDLFY